MALEIGGRADKSGNRFEHNWIIYKILEVFQEKVEYILIEAIGEDEKGVDLWIGYKDGSREGQQCKSRNGSQAYWDYGSINAKGIADNWKKQLERSAKDKVSLVSPLAFELLEDLTARARNTNENPKDFLKYQIEESGTQTRNFFSNLCKRFRLNYRDDNDLIKMIDYLSRIYYRQNADFEFKNCILWQIGMLFWGEPEQIYAEILNYLLSKDIWGQKIDLMTLENFMQERGISYRHLERDSRILPKINILNEEYRNNYIYFRNGLVERKETSECRQAILEGKSIIIHGKAGIGKSGCTENIIKFCEESGMLYLAIKLDKRIPHSTSEIWASTMGLPASIASCLHCFSKNRRAVLILDQLDALRWTQAHSGEALNVCFQIINEIKNINIERKVNISIILVCRTYDLENDHNICNIFKQDENKHNNIEWTKIRIQDLDQTTVKQILGGKYDRLSKKLHELIKIPSNLYILEQLDMEMCCDSITTTQQLINEWWKQINRKAELAMLSNQELNIFKDRMTQFCERKGKLYVPLTILKIGNDYIDFLRSNGFIIIQDNKVSFVHQSVLDCFLAEYMLHQYYKDMDIEEIIGDVQRQNPGKRYQVQMFMQQLLEVSTEDFIDAGKRMLKALNIRYNVKYVFLEILSQIEFPDRVIGDFISEYTDDSKWEQHIIRNVIWGRPYYIHILLEKGVLDDWMKDKKRRIQAINLLISCSPNYADKDIQFIKNFIFQDTKEAASWSGCFNRDINEDSDELFELRMQFYEKYPELSNHYLDFKAMMEACEIRTIRLLVFWLKNKIKNQNQSKILYRYEENLVHEDAEVFVEHYMEVIEMILPHLPKKDEDVSYDNWSEKYFYRIELERVCIQILKKANRIFAKKEPDNFIKVYKPYFTTGNALYNEMLLDAFAFLPTRYADFVIEYLCTDFNKTLFEDTSGNQNTLLLAKNVISKYSRACSEMNYFCLEDKIIHYIDLYSVQRYKNRIEYNREKHGHHTVYWNFWGDFQREMLQGLPDDRKSKQAKDMLLVLRRALGQKESIYMYNFIHSGIVTSPIDGKELTLSNWKGILTSSKIEKRGSHHRKKVKGGFIENTIDTFSGTFSDVVSKKTEEMIGLMLDIDENIEDAFIDSLYSGILISSQLDEINITLLERLFVKFPCDYKSFRAGSFCHIIKKRKNAFWSRNTLNMLKDIAVYHINPSLDKPNVTQNDDKEMRTVEMLESNAINCVRGMAAETIGNLLWENSELYDIFRDNIEKLCFDENPAVRFASLSALWPVYNIDRKWAEGKIIALYKHDYRLVGFRGSRDMLFRLHSFYKDDVLEIVKQCFFSDDKRLVQVGAYTIAEMYICKNEFQGMVENVSRMNRDQAEAIIEIMVIYLGIPEYNERAKEVLKKYINIKYKIEMPWSRLFYDEQINLRRDKEFLIMLMSSNISRRILHSFVYYLEKNRVSLVEYSDIILEMGASLLNAERDNNEMVWGVATELSKLIIALYDETSDKQSEKYMEIANRCLDIWDIMYKNQIGLARELTSKMMEL